MRAARLHQQGITASLVVDEIPVPRPFVEEVLVRVEAAGINFADLMIRFGAYPMPVELPFTPGVEVVGEVVEVGPAVTELSVGDRVVASVSSGGYAEYCVVGVHNARRLTADDDAVGVLAMSLQGLTALGALTDAARLQPEDVVLVHAAAGGVGSIAVQVAKSLGARVVAAVGSSAKVPIAESLGADLVVDSSEDAWTDRVRRGVGTIDVVLDSVGGAVTAANLTLLTPGRGRIVLLGGASGAPKVELFDLIGTGTTITGYTTTSLLADPDRRAGALATLAGMTERGEVRPLIGQRFTLADAENAHQFVASRRSTGKVVLVP